MPKLPKIGEKITFQPKAFENGLTIECERTVTGTVVWVHPRGRYYTVEVNVHGNTWRETMYPGEN